MTKGAGTGWSHQGPVGIRGVFERHITVQIVDAGRRLTIAVMLMRAHESREDVVRRLVEATPGLA